MALPGCAPAMMPQTSCVLPCPGALPDRLPHSLDRIGEGVGVRGPCSTPDAVLHALCVLGEIYKTLLCRLVKLLVGGREKGPFAGSRNRRKDDLWRKTKRLGFFSGIAILLSPHPQPCGLQTSPKERHLGTHQLYGHPEGPSSLLSPAQNNLNPSTSSQHSLGCSALK